VFFSLGAIWRASRIASMRACNSSAEKGRGEIGFVRRSRPSRFQDSCKLVDPGQFLNCAGTGLGTDRQLLISEASCAPSRLDEWGVIPSRREDRVDTRALRENSGREKVE
jgi:hypothetical protein